MAGSFERIAGAKEENTIFGSITRFWESPLRHLLMKEEAPQYLKTIRAILSSNEIINPTPNQVAGFRSHATDPDCEPGEHWIYDEGRYSMSDSDRGMESTATDEGEARGTHVKRKEKTPSMSERAEKKAGVPTKKSRILVLYHGDKTYYSRTDPPMAKKMVELELFSTESNAKTKIPKLNDYGKEIGIGLKFKLIPGARGFTGKDIVPHGGACGSKMSSDLNVWMSVGEIPKGNNVEELKSQPKRKRAQDEGN